MKVYLRFLHYLAPLKSRIVLVVFVSMITSLLNVVSIYSVLPLLNALFKPIQTTEQFDASPQPAQEQTSSSTETTAKPEPFYKNLVDVDQLKASAKQFFTDLFYADTPQGSLLKICIFLIIAFALKNLFIYLNKQIIFNVQTRTAKTIRDDVFKSIIEMQLDYFNRQRVGSLMNHVYNEVQMVTSTLNTALISFLQHPFSVLVFMLILLALSWQLTIFALAVSGLIFFVIRVVGGKIRSQAKGLELEMGNMNSLLQEKFNGIKVIKASAFEDIEFARFQLFTRNFRKRMIRINRLKNVISPLNETLLITAIAMVLWFGGIQVFDERMDGSELLLFAFTLYSIMGPIKSFGEAYTQVQHGAAAAERLFTVLDEESDIKNGTQAIGGFSHSIRFEDVCFKYSKNSKARHVLDHVSFEIKKGEMVALVGQSGSGKSTVVDLLLRFYDVDSGRITIDGTDIREFDYKQLRHLIGVVSQEVILFNDTIENNIAYGVRGEVAHEQVERAARLANAHGFIEEKPEQYQTLIGDRGIQLSGGQRQRLAIARAMVKNPELLIFDEATSALDNESEKVVQQAIDHALVNRTALVVAHRLSTVKNADRIIVMERGKVMESGSHQELIEHEGLYKHLYDIQFGEKEKV